MMLSDDRVVNVMPRKGFMVLAWVLLVFLILTLTLVGCGRKRRHENNKVNLPITLVRVNNLGLAVDEPGVEGFGLTATATNLFVSVSGCASGNVVNATTVNTGTISVLYTGDRNCLVKLLRFTLGSTTYSATAAGAMNFTTWLVGDAATFANISSSTDTIGVFVKTQVTQGGVTGSDTVVYAFTDVAAATTKSLVQASVSSGVSLPTLNSITAPNFTIQQVRFLDGSNSGGLQLAFTVSCSATVTGSSASTYACSDYNIQNGIDYILVPDLYSQGAITLPQAYTAFLYNVESSAGTSIVGAGGIDDAGNTLTNGGFFTSTTSPLTTQVFPGSYQNYVLFLRGKDSLGNATGYQYFYVNVSLNSSF